jgi:hypothetical protein
MDARSTGVPGSQLDTETGGVVYKGPTIFLVLVQRRRRPALPQQSAPQTHMILSKRPSRTSRRTPTGPPVNLRAPVPAPACNAVGNRCCSAMILAWTTFGYNPVWRSFGEFALLRAA